MKSFKNELARKLKDNFTRVSEKEQQERQAVGLGSCQERTGEEKGHAICNGGLQTSHMTKRLPRKHEKVQKSMESRQ